MDAHAQAESFADVFSTHGGHDPLPLSYGSAGNTQLNQPFSLNELDYAINHTKVTTPGEDKISAKLFKGLNTHARKLLLQVYNQIWTSCDLPQSWTSAIIMPILKPGKQSRNPLSYRPIALTSVTCKICEKIISRRISLFLTQNLLIAPNHLGFLPFRDGRVAITKLYHDCQKARTEKKFIFGVSLDLKSAYDSIYIDGLIFKCLQLGITDRILLWIYNFLNNRIIKILWRRVLSAPRSLGRGVPQGSVLSPVLFTIFMCDLVEHLGSRIRCLMYADDIFLHCVRDSISTGRSLLQDALRVASQ